jgi:undecaprenyl diphosphate synthase
LHVAIIMDGNGRWASRRGLPRSEGHRAGADTVRRIVRAAPGQGISVLTLYAFSSDNWRRPPLEVAALMRLFSQYLQLESETCQADGVRLTVTGRRDRLARPLRTAIELAERRTAGGRNLWLRIALDYSGRDQLLRAAGLASGRGLTREAFALALGAVGHDRGPTPDVDLLIRTGGERRVSNFLVWQSSYSEYYFTDLAWPDFDAAAVDAALLEYAQRRRRFGRVDAGGAEDRGEDD